MKRTLFCLLVLLTAAALAACAERTDFENEGAYSVIAAASAALAETDADFFRVGGYTYVPLEVITEALGIDFSIEHGRITELDAELLRAGLEAEDAAGLSFFLGPDVGIDLFRGTGGAFLVFDNELFLEQDSPGSVHGTTIRDNRGNTYTRYLAIFSRTEPTRLEIPLDERFAAFTFDLALPERYANDRDTLLLNIFGDGRLLFTEEVTFGHRPARVEIDVTDVSRLWIIYESGNFATIYGAILGNPTFILDEGGDDR